MYFIRHGFSCANVASENVVHRKYYLDPPLSDAGVRDSKKMRTIVSRLEIDVVCCSVMNRAIETALLMFPRHIIFVVPHIKELDDECDSIANKMAFFEKTYPRAHKRIYYGFVDDKNIRSSSFPKFKKFMKTYFSHVNDENIAAVTHMAKHLRIHYKEQKHPPMMWSRCAKKQTIIIHD